MAIKPLVTNIGDFYNESANGVHVGTTYQNEGLANRNAYMKFAIENWKVTDSTISWTSRSIFRYQGYYNCLCCMQGYLVIDKNGYVRREWANPNVEPYQYRSLWNDGSLEMVQHLFDANISVARTSDMAGKRIIPYTSFIGLRAYSYAHNYGYDWWVVDGQASHSEGCLVLNQFTPTSSDGSSGYYTGLTGYSDNSEWPNGNDLVVSDQSILWWENNVNGRYPSESQVAGSVCGFKLTATPSGYGMSWDEAIPVYEPTVYVYNGSAWKPATNVYVYDGSAWQEATSVQVYNGTAWKS